MASISKTIMATAFMQLWEDGLVNLDDNVNNYLLPDFQVVNPSHPNDTITIKMLMTHTSSINDNYNVLWSLLTCGDSPIPLDSFFVNYFTPGGIYYSTANFNGFSPSSNIYDYSNVGSSLLAYIVQKLSGIPYDQYCRVNIFDPLDMNEASLFLQGLDTTNIATPYEWVGGQYSALCHQGCWPIYPIAQLRINKIELEHFLTTYLNWGTYNGITILDSTTVNMMLSDQMGHPDPYGDYQGLIWYKMQYDGRWLWGHTGAWPGCGTAMFFIPEENWGFTMFLNTRPENEGFWNIVNAISDYAHLYGNIYALNTKVDKPFIRPSIDTLTITTKFSNISQHNFTANALIVSSDSSYIDSTILYDDGLHGDSLAGDGLWGGFIHSVSQEDFFDIGISTTDLQTGEYFYTSDLTKFTTAGPIAIDTLEISYLPTPDLYEVKPHIKNEGVVLTIENLNISMSSDDTTITLISGPLYLGSIAPGETIIHPGHYTVRVDSNFSGEFRFNFDITSDGWLYWKDSIPDTGTTDVQNEITLPVSYTLHQNYPNPFNPSTTIQYDIKERSLVELVLYDVLGREVEVLVNREQNAGYYKIDFNAGRLASGIYFYRIQAGDFVETKKMVLMK